MENLLIRPDAVDYSVIPSVPEGTCVAPLQRPGHLAEDWLEPQQRVYTPEEHGIWDDLFAQQMDVLPGRAASSFMAGLERLDLGRGGVPDFQALSEELQPITGWSVVPVPMLTDPVYADYMQEYGRAGWKALAYNRLKALSALYWYTVEFGLIREADGIKAYGAGILSGPLEAKFSVEGRSPNRIHLEVDRVMRTDYVISDMQPTYFVIDSFEELFRKTVERNFDDLYRGLNPGFTYSNQAVLGGDKVYHLGSQEYANRGGQGSGAKPV